MKQETGFSSFHWDLITAAIVVVVVVVRFWVWTQHRAIKAKKIKELEWQLLSSHKALVQLKTCTATDRWIRSYRSYNKPAGGWRLRSFLLSVKLFYRIYSSMNCTIWYIKKTLWGNRVPKRKWITSKRHCVVIGFRASKWQLLHVMFGGTAAGVPKSDNTRSFG